MCGICYVKRLDGKRAKKSIVKRYQSQKSRGKEGFGYVAVDDGYIVDYVRAAKEHDIMEKMKNQSANEILFHHRFPTSTPNFSSCAHPIKVSHPTLKYDYYVVHNGVIMGDEELKEGHEKLGFAYTTEVINEWKTADGKNVTVQDVKWNDSESLAIELARDIDSGELKGLKHIRGSVALICLQAEKESKRILKLYYARNDANPLKIDMEKGRYISITSEGQGAEVESHKLFYFDYLTNEHLFLPYEIGYNYSSPIGYNTGNTYHSTKKEYKYDYDEEIGHLWKNRQDEEDYSPPLLPKTTGQIMEEKDKSFLIIPSTQSEDYFALLEERDYMEEIIETTAWIKDAEDLEYWKAELEKTEMLIKRIEDEADRKELEEQSSNPT